MSLLNVVRRMRLQPCAARSIAARLAARSVACGALLAATLGVAIGVTPQRAHAQVDTTRRPVPRDTARAAAPAAPKTAADSAAEVRLRREAFRADSLRRDSLDKAIRGDTIKAPLARFEMPDQLELNDRLRFTREQILASGAENLTDLLDRVPGVTTYRSGWMAGIHAASYLGDGARVRLFLDGVELDPIAARNRGTEDLTDISLWTLDELVIERAPGEVRVWMRSWTVTKTIPFTRVDIFTGDLNTNAFRAQFSRRWRNGFLLQVGGQQIATQTGRASAFTSTELKSNRSDGTVQGFMLRTGWSRGRLSVDAFADAVMRDRDAHRARTDFVNLPSYKGQRRNGYFRVGYGDTTKGFWSQVVVQALRTKLDNPDSIEVANNDTTRLQTDTVRGRTQQLAAVGYRSSNWHVSLTDRMRVEPGLRRQAPAVRAGVTLGIFDAAAWAEQNGADSTTRADLVARVRPTDWLRVTGGISRRSPEDSTGRPAGTTMRVEGALRVHRLWVGGGLIRDDASGYANIELIGLPPALMSSVAAQGVLGSVYGSLYKALRFDLQAIRWNTAQYNRPQTQIHAELALISDWRKKFPKGEFGINTRLIYDRRGGVPMYYVGAGGEADNQVTEPAQVVTGLLEIRIQQATIFYQYRNLTGGAYEQIRGITMPPGVQMYGVRWNFFN